MIRLKRVFEKRSDDDGYRVLVDRKWPTGVRKESAALDYWAKELTPSDALSEFLRVDARRWLPFRARFIQEIKSSPAALKTMSTLAELSKTRAVTLLSASRNVERSAASILREGLEKLVEKPLPPELRDEHTRSTRRRDRARLKAFPPHER